MAENSFWVDDVEQNAKDDLSDLLVEEPHGSLGLSELPVDKMDWLPLDESKDEIVVEEPTGHEWDIDMPPEHAQHFEEREKSGLPPYDLDKDQLGELVVTEEEEVPGAPGAKLLKEEDKVDDKPKDWEKGHNHSQFVSYVKDKMKKGPKHSGETIPGCERFKSFLKSIDNEISSAMRSDLDGVIDEHQIDAMRKEIEKMVERLDHQINKLKKKTKKADLNVRLVSEGQCEKCQSVAPMWHDIENNKMVCMHCESEAEAPSDSDQLEKKANTPVLNVYITAFERAIVGTIVNSAVSAGRDIEETYERLKNKYNFTPREELAIQQLIADYGYPTYKDRGLLNEPSDPSSDDGIDWMTQYHA